MCAKKGTLVGVLSYMQKREKALASAFCCVVKMFCLRMADRRQRLRRQAPVQEGREP